MLNPDGIDSAVTSSYIRLRQQRFEGFDNPLDYIGGLAGYVEPGG